MDKTGNYKGNSNLFDVNFNWTELCTASVTIKANDEHEAKAIVKKQIANYLDHCVSNGSTQLVERDYGSLEVVFSKENISEFPEETILNEDTNIDSEFYLEYKGIEIYSLYKDFETKDSIWEYHYTLDQNDSDGFDIRELSSYNKELSVVENLKLAIDNNLL